ncbi:MAG TPA: tetratricopeptide repeat protein [Nannocystis exedens]|nr:tetratricopeptide repeat protein [Nannocystis exedens]
MEHDAKAKQHLDAALRYFDAHVQQGRINSDQIAALQLLAELERLSGSYERAIDTLERAIQLLQAEGDHAPLEAYTRGILGELLVDEGHYAEALPHLQAAFDNLNERGSAEDDSTSAYLVSALASAQAHTGDHRSAQRSAKLAKQLAERFHLGDAPEILDRLQPIPQNPNPPQLKEQSQKDKSP